MSIRNMVVSIESYGTVQGGLMVEFDRYDGDRAQYKWEVRDHEGRTLGKGDDLRSGTGADPDHADMLAALCDFLVAAAEGDCGAFPPAVVEWADANSDALGMAGFELRGEDR